MMTWSQEIKYLISNPRTTFWGLAPFIGGILSMADGIAALAHISIPGITVIGDPWHMIGSGLVAAGAGMAAFAAKDSNVTGGAKSNAKE
jgi:hypothetical protein